MYTSVGNVIPPDLCPVRVRTRRAASRSHIFRAPEDEPAQTSSSVWPNRTHSTGVVWPQRLCKEEKEESGEGSHLDNLLGVTRFRCVFFQKMRLVSWIEILFRHFGSGRVIISASLTMLSTTRRQAPIKRTRSLKTASATARERAERYSKV